MNTQSKEEQTFDANRPISIKTLSSEGIKTIEVRFPTDEEWIARSRRHRIVYRNLGRGSQELVSEEPNESDAELLAQIRTGDGPEADIYEAYRILEELSRVQALEDPSPESGCFRIRLRVPGAITIQTFRMPTAKERFRLQKVAVPKFVDNREIWFMNYDLVATLHEAMCQEIAGYAGAVPIIHKLAALQALNMELARALEVGEPENF